MRFTTTLLPDPIKVRLPGRRSQSLTVAVLDGGAVLALFQDENRAEAYTRRLNRLILEMGASQ